MQLDIKQNRAASKYPLSIQIRRFFWALGNVVFRLVPRPLYAPRPVLLRIFGAQIGRSVNIANSAIIYSPWNLKVGNWSSIGEHAFIYNFGEISIGAKTTISQRAHLCAGTHDYREPTLPLQTPPVEIGAQAWICADAFIGPGVTVGEGAVIGARAVVTKDVEPWTVVAGNPARVLKKREFRG